MQNKIFKLGITLFAIAAVSGLILGVTNAVTEGPIAQQTVEAANAARQSVLPEAADFQLVSEAKDDVKDIYEGTDASGNPVGYTAMTTVKGYGGEIEVTIGVDMDGTVTGVNVGGANFSETAGLGAKTKEPWFAQQFVGATTPIQLTKDGGSMDAVTSATISSRAVTGGVNTIATYLTTLAKEGK